MIGDTFALGVLSGLIGNVAKNLSNYLLFRRKVTTEVYHRVAASVFVDPGLAERPLGKVVGFVTDAMVAGASGVPIAYILKLTGKDYYPLKGLAIGVASWFTFYGLLGGLGIVKIRPGDPATILSGLWNNALYGVVASYAAVKLGDPRSIRSAEPMRKSYRLASLPSVRKKLPEGSSKAAR